ncbi:hypothetical protein DFO77_10988 [Marinilabilia salmonicolor]|jgi:hypothetical protein|uniref:Uncharacterized protein n=1 Tax=Marinilabilia salmonicolor TaxID=989 RepID=A0A368V8Y0_9BACT|nr:hypothetical protein DFO77_10988 [Marinilabilia salmonicolor]
MKSPSWLLILNKKIFFFNKKYLFFNIVLSYICLLINDKTLTYEKFVFEERKGHA